MKTNIEITVHHYHIIKHEDEQGNISDIILKSILQLNKTAKQMGQSLDALKAQVAAQGETIMGISDTITTLVDGVTGVGADVAFLKAKIEELSQNEDGASQAELTEVLTLAQGVSAKLEETKTKLAEAATRISDLDAATDSGETEGDIP